MTKTMQQHNSDQLDTEKAKKVYTLTQHYREIKSKRKSICAAMTDEMKRTQSEIDDIMSGNMTAEEILENIHEPHDLSVVK